MAQAQKEVFVNEALSITDALLHCAMEGEAAAPPGAPVDGETWLVAAGASGDWTGQDHALACRQGGNWIFVQPRDGMRVFDLSRGQEQLFLGSWQYATSPVEPLGGTTVDSEARAAIADLLVALRIMGLLPPT